MKKTTPTTGLARPADSEELSGQPQVGAIEITKVTREFVPLIAEEYGETYGQNIDKLLEEAAKSGQEIQDITLHIAKESWNDYVSAVLRREKYNQA